MPLFENGSVIGFLEKASKQGRVLSKNTSLYLCKQVIKALFELHMINKIAHCDVKPDNFIIKDDYTVGLIDFG